MAEVLKKHRKSNFSQDEIEVLMKTVSENYETLYGEFSKKAINKFARHRAWLEVTKEVNSVSAEKRTLQEVKNKWKKCQHLYHPDDFMSVRYFSDEVLDVTNVWEPLTELEDEGDNLPNSIQLPSKMKLKKSKVRHVKNQIEKLKLTKPTVYDPEFKKTVVSYAEKQGNKEARRLYGVAEYNIRRWRGKTRLISQKQENNAIKREVKESDSLDSMPLEQRLKVPATTVLTPPPETQGTEQVLQSQPLSPTKLKVTRQVKPSAPSPIPPPLSPTIEEVCLRWNSHHSNMQHTFPNLLLREQYVDATLVADGQTLKCHRVILSSCSPYFEDVLASISPYQHPVLFMKDVPFWILKCLCDFMYSGEVHILQTKLEDLLEVAETLKIKGLAVQPDTKMMDRKPEFTIPIKEEKFDEKELKKKEEKEFRRKEEKEVKKREEKEVKKKEEKEIKKKEERECKKKEETKLLEIKPLKKKEEKEFAKKDEKITKKKEEIKEKKRVTIVTSPERSVIKNKVPKVVIQTPVPILKNLSVKSNRPRSTVESKKRERKLEKEKIPINTDIPSTSSFTNPFGLLKPVYEEVTKDPKPGKLAVVKDPKNVNVKRTLQKKLKKRKMTDEREESPPPSRKGTRSRPRSKVPKYYHPSPVPSYDQSTIVREPHTDEAFLRIQDIKSEPIYDDSIEIEDNLVGFSESSISVEEHLIDSYDSTFDSFNINTHTNHSKPIITVQSLVDQHTLKIVNVAELKENSDPLEDPLGLNQSSSDGASMVEQTDNTLGFRISEVVTAKEDSQSSDACRELGFKITSIVSGQEEGTTKLYEEQEFEDRKPIFSLIQPEDSNQQNKIDTNEDISYKIKEELINVQEKEKKTVTRREISETVEIDDFVEEKTELPNQLSKKKISVIQEAHSSEENLLTTNKSETLPESGLTRNCQFKSSSNVPQFEDKDDLYIPQPSSSANVLIEEKNITEDQTINEDYNKQQITGENCDVEESSSNIPDLSERVLDKNEENSSNVPLAETFHCDENQLIEESSSNNPHSNLNFLENQEANTYQRTDNIDTKESSSNIPDSRNEAFHCDENQLINENIEESSSNEQSQPVDNNFEESSSNIPVLSNPGNAESLKEEEENISNNLHSEAFNCNENQRIEENFEENSDSVPKVSESSSNGEKDSSSNEGVGGDLKLNAQLDENSQHEKPEEGFSMEITCEEKISEETNDKNRLEDESSSNVPLEIVPLTESMETDIDEISAKQEQEDDDKKEESCLNLQSESNWNYRNEINYEDFNNKNNSEVLERFEEESSSNVPPDIIENCQTTDYNLHTDDTSSSNEPGFHIARVISEQIAEIEGNRVIDTGSVNEQCESVSNSNELESIVNDLSRIVGGSCEESSTGADDTNSMADCLENLLQK